MEVNKQRLNEIADKIKKIRIFENEEGVKYFNETAAEAIDSLSEDADIIKENFAYFAKRPTSIMYPEEFLRIMQNISGGRQMLADNLEYILETFINKKVRARLELVGIPEVSKKVSENFENLFNMAMYRGKPESNYDQDPSLRYVPCCPDQKKNDFTIFLKYVSGAENPSEILEKNKELFLNYSFNSGMLEMVKVLSKNPKCHQFIRDNIETIKENCYVPHLAELCTSIREICPEEFEKEAFTIDNIYLPAIATLESQNVQGKNYAQILSQINLTCSEVIKQGRTDDFEKLMNFMMKSTNNDELKVCGSGFFNITIQAGDKAIKIGARESNNDKEEPKVPYHPRILLPTIRKKDVSRDSKHPIFVAMYETVDVDVEITDEEMLEVYKELREDGIRWLDIKKENLGRLRKDNLQYEIGSNVPTPLEYLGFEESGVEKRTLKKGDLVIIDLDYIYQNGKADELDFVSENVPQCIIDYEREYMRRKNEEKAKAKSEVPSPHDEH